MEFFFISFILSKVITFVCIVFVIIMHLLCPNFEKLVVLYCFWSVDVQVCACIHQNAPFFSICFAAGFPSVPPQRDRISLLQCWFALFEAEEAFMRKIIPNALFSLLCLTHCLLPRKHNYDLISTFNFSTASGLLLLKMKKLCEQDHFQCLLFVPFSYTEPAHSIMI